MQQLPVLKSLEHANMWDMSTFDLLLSRALPPQDDNIQVCTTPIEQVLCTLTSALQSSLTPPYVTQWLVSNSNLHLTLARLSLTSEESLGKKLMSSLHSLLNCEAVDALKWTQDLLDAGFQHSVQKRAREYPCATGLLAHLHLHHIQHASPTDRTCTSVMQLLPTNDISQLKESVLKHLPGVYHFAGFRTRDWEPTTMAPLFASFQVDRDRLSFSVGTDDLVEDSDEHDPSWFDDLTDQCIVVKMTGNGQYVDERGKTSTAELNVTLVREGSDLKMHATIGGSARMTLSGFISDPLISGSISYWSDPVASDTEIYSLRGGAFLFWRSALPDTESNWNGVYLRDIEALRKLRTPDGFEYERSSLVASREKPDFNNLNTRPPLERVRDSILKEKHFFHAACTLATHGSTYISTNAMAERVKENTSMLKNRSRIDCSNVLPRGMYETDEMHAMRIINFRYQQTHRPQQRTESVFLLRAGNGLGDLITLCTALKRLFSALREDAERPLDKRLTKDFLTATRVLGFNQSSSELPKLIHLLDDAVNHLNGMRTRYGSMQLPSLEVTFAATLELLRAHVKILLEVQSAKRVENPVETALASERILKFLLEEDKPKPSINSSGESDAVANESSPLCKAIVAEYERLDSQNDLTIVIRKWSYVFGTARPGIDVNSENIIPSLMVALCNSLQLRFGTNDTESEDSKDNEKNGDSEPLCESDDDCNVDSMFATKSHTFGIVPTTLIAIGTVSAIFGLATFALGRWLTKH